MTFCRHGDCPADKPKVFYNLLVTENYLQLLDPEVRTRLSRKVGTVEMTQSIRCLLCRYEDLSLDPWHPGNMPVMHT